MPDEPTPTTEQRPRPVPLGRFVLARAERLAGAGRRLAVGVAARHDPQRLATLPRLLPVNAPAVARTAAPSGPPETPSAPVPETPIQAESRRDEAERLASLSGYSPWAMEYLLGNDEPEGSTSFTPAAASDTLQRKQAERAAGLGPAPLRRARIDEGPARPLRLSRTPATAPPARADAPADADAAGVPGATDPAGAAPAATAVPRGGAPGSARIARRPARTTIEERPSPGEAQAAPASAEAQVARASAEPAAPEATPEAVAPGAPAAPVRPGSAKAVAHESTQAERAQPAPTPEPARSPEAGEGTPSIAHTPQVESHDAPPPASARPSHAPVPVRLVQREQTPPPAPRPALRRIARSERAPTLPPPTAQTPPGADPPPAATAAAAAPGFAQRLWRRVSDGPHAAPSASTSLSASPRPSAVASPEAPTVPAPSGASAAARNLMRLFRRPSSPEPVRAAEPFSEPAADGAQPAAASRTEVTRSHAQLRRQARADIQDAGPPEGDAAAPSSPAGAQADHAEAPERGAAASAGPSGTQAHDAAAPVTSHVPARERTSRRVLRVMRREHAARAPTSEPPPEPAAPVDQPAARVARFATEKPPVAVQPPAPPAATTAAGADRVQQHRTTVATPAGEAAPAVRPEPPAAAPRPVSVSRAPAPAPAPPRVPFEPEATPPAVAQSSPTASYEGPAAARVVARVAGPTAAGAASAPAAALPPAEEDVPAFAHAPTTAAAGSARAAARTPVSGSTGPAWVDASTPASASAAPVRVAARAPVGTPEPGATPSAGVHAAGAAPVAGVHAAGAAPVADPRGALESRPGLRLARSVPATPPAPSAQPPAEPATSATASELAAATDGAIEYEDDGRVSVLFPPPGAIVAASSALVARQVEAPASAVAPAPATTPAPAVAGPAAATTAAAAGGIDRDELYADFMRRLRRDVLEQREQLGEL